MKALKLFALCMMASMIVCSCDKDDDIINGMHEHNGGESCPLTQEGAAMKYIDLGLPSGTLWADKNIGSYQCQGEHLWVDSGDFFAWGEVIPKTEFTWENYKFRVPGEYTDHYITKYMLYKDLDGIWGKYDGKDTLEPCDDVAHTRLGGDWHMPTVKQCNELMDNTTWKWTVVDDKKGWIGVTLTSKINGKSIYFPAAGFFYDGKKNIVKYSTMFVWACATNGCDDAYRMTYRDTGNNIVANSYRNYGMPVRAVMDAPQQ